MQKHADILNANKINNMASCLTNNFSILKSSDIDAVLKSHEKAKKSRFISKYGVYGLLPAVPFLGFYVCPAIAWIFGWKRGFAATLIIMGFVIISTIMLLSSIGVLEFISE